MAEFYTVVTDAGREAVARATQVGEKVDITHFAAGDGGGSAVTPDESQTQLVNECWRGLVSTYKQEGTNIIIDTYISADEESFTVREMGIFTADGVLFAVCNTPEMRKVLPSEGAVGNFTLGMEIDVTNIDMSYIEIHTNPELDFIPNSEKGQPDGVAPLNKDGVLDIIYGGTGAKTAQEAIKNLGAIPSYVRTIIVEDSSALDNIKEEGLFFFIDSKNEFGAGFSAGFELFVTKTIFSNSETIAFCQRLTAVYRSQISDPISFWRTYYYVGGWSEWKQISTREKQQTFLLPLNENAQTVSGYSCEYSISQNGIVTINANVKLTDLVGTISIATMPSGFIPSQTICTILNRQDLVASEAQVNIFGVGNGNIAILTNKPLTGNFSFSASYVAGG